MTTFNVGIFANRMTRAALLDASLYEEVEADRSAGWQSVAVVLLASLAAGIGVSGWHGPSLTTSAAFTALALITWTAWAMLIAQIGGGPFREAGTHTSFGELLRTVGFAAAPGLFQIFAAMPGMAWPVFGVTTIWMLAAMIVAVRQALDYRHTPRAVAVCVAGLALALVLAFVLGVLLAPPVS
jgi:hypothetical protein